MDQKRLLIAFVLSAVILFGWTYLFPPPANETQNANTSQPANTSPTPAPSQQPAQADAQPVLTAPAAPDAVPQRTVIFETPLYTVTLDSRGATAKSWIIKKNKEKGGEGK